MISNLHDSASTNGQIKENKLTPEEIYQREFGDVATGDCLKMSAVQQKELLSYLIKDIACADACLPIIEPAWFTHDCHKKVVKIVKEFKAKYGGLPNKETIKVELETAYKDKSFETQARLLAEFSHVWEFVECDNTSMRDYYIDKLRTFAHECASKAGCRQFLESYDIKHLDTLNEKLKNLAISGQDAEDDDFSLIEFLEYGASIERHWIIPDWICGGSATLIHGAKKEGKSTTVYSMIPALLQGSLWLDTLACEQVPIVYLDYEDPADYSRENLLDYMTMLDADLVDKWFISPKPGKLPVAITVDFIKSKILKFIKRGIDKPGLVIINAALSAFRGLFPDQPGWDNLADTVRSALDPITAWCHQSGWAVLIIHHDNKKGDTGGSVHWEAACDYVLDYGRRNNLADNQRELKIRGRIKQQPMPIVIEKRPDNKIYMVGTVKELVNEKKKVKYQEAKNEDERLILDILPVIDGSAANESNTRTIPEIIKKTDLPETTVRRILKQMADNKRICKHKLKEGIKEPYHYWVEVAFINQPGM